MNPFAILPLLKALTDCLSWVFGAIDTVKQAEAAKTDVLKKLKTSMSIVGSNISIFKKLISALESPENERFHSAFIQRCATAPRFALGIILSHGLFQTRCQGCN